ncbi:hypothetical protein QR680_012293 [Steinernema hermaphroditum]|uniref:Uncharacterized protein n=1 Tax=Steinernema hermaphroditum TaxID=289476 RepID=A0AA39M097_9BILA|nr:hypothetical protein QR680_012293 [Steinernema hermaphroditum]
MREDNTNAHNEHKEEMPTDTGGEDGLDYDVEGLFDVQNGIKKSETEKRPVGPMMITATALWKSMEQNNKIKSCLQHREILRRLSSNLEYMEYTFVTLDPDRHPIGRFMNNLEDDRREMEKAFKDIEEADGKLPNVDELTADAKLLANGTVLSSPMRFYKKRKNNETIPLPAEITIHEYQLTVKAQGSTFKEFLNLNLENVVCREYRHQHTCKIELTQLVELNTYQRHGCIILHANGTRKAELKLKSSVPSFSANFCARSSSLPKRSVNFYVRNSSIAMTSMLRNSLRSDFLGAKDIYDEAESVWVPLYVDKRRERAIATVQIPCGRSQRDKWILASVAVFLNSPA